MKLRLLTCPGRVTVSMFSTAAGVLGVVVQGFDLK